MRIRSHRVIASLALPAILAASGCSYFSDLSVCDKPQVDPKASVAACTRLIDSHRLGDATLAGAYIDRAAAWQNLRDPDRALADLDKAISIQPSLGEAWSRRGAVHAAKGEFEQAFADIRHALELNPKDIGAEITLANVLELKHDYAGSLAELDKANRIAPDNPQVLNNRCWNRAVRNSELDQALADCNATLRIAPGDGNALNSRGLVQFRLGHYADAIRDYDAAVAIDPGDGSSFYIRGLAKRALGDRTGAALDIESGKSIDPHVASTYEGYGVTAP